MDNKKLLLEISKIENIKIQELKSIINKYNKIIILGNGGSSSIASHISQDYTKVLKKRVITFSDSSRLTCYSNDYGYENAYKQFINEFADNDTLVILISSSGESKNIINCKEYCQEKNISTIILTGFDSLNTLNVSKNNLLTYHVPSNDYGIVECCHLIFLHSIL